MIRRERTAGAAGILFCAVALLLALLDSRAALTGWLAGFVFWSGIPIGALGLVMMIRIIPGSWSEELEKPAEAALLFLPIAALAALPILIGVHALYGWAAAGDGGGFRGAYLTPWFFVFRTLVVFAVMMALAALLLTRPALSVPVASAGLIVFTLFDTLMATDWIMSLDSAFHSSGFGLYVISLQMTAALAAAIAIRLAFGERAHGERADGERARPKLLGALMLTALLFWAYFAFMQFFIIWSGNFPPEVAWYRRHDDGIWSAAEYLIAALNLIPLVLLLVFAPLRRSRRALLGIAAAVLLGRAIECVWLVIGSVDVDRGIALGAAALALIGLGLLFIACFFWSARNIRLNVPAPHAGG
jgi:hypothetical protein